MLGEQNSAIIADGKRKQYEKKNKHQTLVYASVYMGIEI